MKAKNELLNKIRTFKQIKSITGRATYSNFKLEGNVISFKRDSTGNRRSVDVEMLYNAYLKENFLNTIVLRKHIAKWVFSPSLAILIAAGFYDENGNRKR